VSLALAGVTQPNKRQRRGTLRRRIAGVGNNQQQAMGDYHPWGTADTPQTAILTRVQINASGAQVERLTPLVAPNGEMIPASAPGQWGQVYAAGRP
jgi:hypothetical protein